MFETTDQILRQLRTGEDSRSGFNERRFGERGGEVKPGEPKVA